MHSFVNKLKITLSHPLPGPEAQYLMAPAGRRQREMHEPGSGSYRPSAVMIVLCKDDENRLFIPLIQRHRYNGAHSGQVSFPGGKFEPEDADLSATALRECNEEIGLGNVELIGRLSSLVIPVSGFEVQPYVGYCPEVSPGIVIQEREVSAVIKFYLNDLLNDSLVKQGSVELPDNARMLAPYFELNQYKIWGATAMILSELKTLVKPIF